MSLLASSLIAGFPDPVKAWQQCNVCQPDNADEAMSNVVATKRRMKNQMEGRRRGFADIEIGMPRLATPAGQAFVVDLMNDWPITPDFDGMMFFGGEVVRQLVAQDLDAAQEIAAASSGGVGYPCYFQTKPNGVVQTFEEWLKLWEPRLNIMDGSGIDYTPFVSRQATGKTKPIVADDPFCRCVSYLRGRRPKVMAWHWAGQPWNVRGALETRTAHRAGDEDLLVLSAATGG